LARVGGVLTTFDCGLLHACMRCKELKGAFTEIMLIVCVMNDAVPCFLGGPGVARQSWAFVLPLSCRVIKAAATQSRTRALELVRNHITSSTTRSWSHTYIYMYVMVAVV